MKQHVRRRSASTSTTTPSARWPTRWPRCWRASDQVQGTINGFGERCGNANLVSIIPSLVLKLGLDCIPEPAPARAARPLALRLRAGQPQAVVARSPTSATRPSPTRAACTSRRSQKHPETYEHVDPEAVGNHRRVLVSELAGKSNILWKAREFGIDLDQRHAGLPPDPRPAQGARGRGIPVRGRRGVVRAPDGAGARPPPAVLRARGLPGDRRGAEREPRSRWRRPPCGCA